MSMTERVRDYVGTLRIGDTVVFQDNQEFYRGVVRLISNGEIHLTGTDIIFSQSTSYAIGEESDRPPRIMYPTQELSDKLKKHEEIRGSQDAFAALFDRDTGLPDRFLRSAWSSLCRARNGEFPEGRLARHEYLSEIREMIDDDTHYDIPINKVREMINEAKDIGID